MKTRLMADQPRSGLLSLPEELRTMIYDYFLSSLPETYRETKDYKDLEPTALLSSCRQIRAELSRPYSEWAHANVRDLLNKGVYTVPSLYPTINSLCGFRTPAPCPPWGEPDLLTDLESKAKMLNATSWSLQLLKRCQDRERTLAAGEVKVVRLNTKEKLIKRILQDILQEMEV